MWDYNCPSSSSLVKEDYILRVRGRQRFAELCVTVALWDLDRGRGHPRGTLLFLSFSLSLPGTVERFHCLQKFLSRPSGLDCNFHDRRFPYDALSWRRWPPLLG